MHPKAIALIDEMRDAVQRARLEAMRIIAAMAPPHPREPEPAQ